MTETHYEALFQFLELLVPHLLAQRVDAISLVRCRVGEFDNYKSRWAIQLRYPQMERKKYPGKASKSIYQAGTERLFVVDGELVKDDEPQGEVYGLPLLSYVLNANEGLLESAEPVRRPLDTLEKVLPSFAEAVDRLGLDRLYLVYFSDEVIGRGYVFCTRELKGQPSQFPRAESQRTSFRASMLVATVGASGNLDFLLQEASPRKTHRATLNNLFKSGAGDSCTLQHAHDQLKHHVIRRIRGITGYSHC
jgi:hypothetical protein